MLEEHRARSQSNPGLTRHWIRFEMKGATVDRPIIPKAGRTSVEPSERWRCQPKVALGLNGADRLSPRSSSLRAASARPLQ